MSAIGSAAKFDNRMFDAMDISLLVGREMAERHSQMLIPGRGPRLGVYKIRRQRAAKHPQQFVKRLDGR
jgi:hypothetical protein